MSTIYLDREKAGKILKVSTRTIDRYIRKYHFKTRKNGRKVLIRRADIDKIIEENIGQYIDIHSTKMNNENRAFVVKDIKLEKVKNEGQPKSREENIYKHLYEETKTDLKEKQERLEAATYRVGQLEAQVKNMVPMLDYNHKEKELKEAHSAIGQKALEGQQALIKMERKLKVERIAKWIYLSLVGLLLVAEPVLFIFWALS